MSRNGRSMWHGGGTRTPLTRERGGSASGTRVRRAIGLVPYRAISWSFILQWSGETPDQEVFSAPPGYVVARNGAPVHVSPLVTTGRHDEPRTKDRFVDGEQGGVGEPSEAPVWSLASSVSCPGR